MHQTGLSWLSDVEWEADHIPTGYVYMYDPRSDTPGFVTYLADFDRDGELDGGGEIPDDSWVGSAWSVSSNYIFP